MLREGTRGWITSHSDWICLGDSGTHAQAFEDFEGMEKDRNLPSVLICDLNFYGENTGFDFIEKIHGKYPDVKITVYSMFFAAGMVQSAMENGASAMFLKTQAVASYLDAWKKSIRVRYIYRKRFSQNS